MPTPAIQTLINDAQQVLNLDSISAVRSVVAVSLANANTGTPLNPNLTTQQLWNEFYQVVPRSKSDIESIIANQLMKFLYSPPAPGGVGANGQVIFNNNGVLAGDNELFYNPTTNTLTTEKLIVPGNTQVAGSASNLYVGSILNPTLFVNTNTNRVGIGTATPGTACDVASGTVRVKNAVGDTSGLLIYQDTGDASKIFNYYNGSMQFGINNTTAMTLNATGLGIGQSSPYSKLHIQGASQAGCSMTMFYSGIQTATIGIKSNGSLTLGLDGANGTTDRLLIDTSGNVGIGVAPSAWGSGFRYVQAGPGCAYGTNGSVDRTDVAANWYYNGGDKYINATGKASIFQQSGGAFFWLSTNTASGGAGSAMTLNTNMTLDASGNLLVGTPASGGQNGFCVLRPLSASVVATTTETAHNFGALTGTTYATFLYATTVIGSITQNGTTGVLYNTTSDYRLKESVQPIANGLARVNALKPSIYKWKADGSSGEGFIAHELAEVVPAAVSGEKDAVNEDGSMKPQGVDMSRVVPILVAAIQELTARVQTLETR